MASLAPLAELEDVEDRLGRSLTADETAKVSANLRDASAAVRAYTRRDFTQTEETIRVRPRGYKVILPQRPVVAVTSVAMVSDFNGTEFVTPVPWSWVSGFEIHLVDPAIVINGPCQDWDDDNVWAEIAYTHGYEEIPDNIVGVVANVALRQTTIPNGGYVDSETAGPFTVRYTGAVGGGPLALNDGERRILNSYRRTSRTVELR